MNLADGFQNIRRLSQAWFLFAYAINGLNENGLTNEAANSIGGFS